MGGQGPVLVRTIHWLNHLEFEWKTPLRRQWLSEVMRHNTLVRYDQRGSGLSDWNVSDFSFERTVKDFEELVDAAGLEKFSILGGCQGAAVAIFPRPTNRKMTALVNNWAFVVSNWVVEQCRLSRQGDPLKASNSGFTPKLSLPQS
jgi:hypothetical protein